MEEIKIECEKLGIKPGNIDLIRDKSGIVVARAFCGDKTYIIKYFRASDQRREIENYRILRSIGVPTLELIQSCETSILLEDIAVNSSQWRIGSEYDLDDVGTARSIAEWYRILHKRGREYVQVNGSGMYDESEYFTRDSIEYIKYMTNTKDNHAWAELEYKFDDISAKLKTLDRTLTYNDFYYTNLAVRRSDNNAGALMFDYNLLGKGYVYSDIRNVLSSMSERAGAEFISCYGSFDESERVIDEIVSPVISLLFACRCKEEHGIFPEWGKALLSSFL